MVVALPDRAFGVLLDVGYPLPSDGGGEHIRPGVVAVGVSADPAAQVKPQARSESGWAIDKTSSLIMNTYHESFRDGKTPLTDKCPVYNSFTQDVKMVHADPHLIYIVREAGRD